VNFLTGLVQSRGQQKSFLFLLPARIATQSVAGGEEKIGRAQIKNLKKTFLLGGERSERRRGVAFKIRSPGFRQKKFGFRPADTTRDDLSCPRPSRSLPRTELVLVRGSGRRKNPKNLTGSPRSSKTAKEPEKISARTTFCLPRSDQSDWSTTGVKEKFYSFRG